MTPLLLLQANRFQDNGEKVTTHWLFALKFSGIILYLSGTEHLSNHSPLCLTHHSFVLFFSPTLFRRKNFEHGGKFNHSCTQRQCSLRDKIPDCVTKVRSDHKHSCSSFIGQIFMKKKPLMLNSLNRAYKFLIFFTWLYFGTIIFLSHNPITSQLVFFVFIFFVTNVAMNNDRCTLHSFYIASPADN